MKFQSLMALALLLLAFDSGAVLLHPEAFPALPNATAAVSAGALVDRSGDRVPNIQHPTGAKVRAQDQAAPVADAVPAGQPLPEPLPLSLLGLGLALLGWTRRSGNRFARLKHSLRQHLFPWPALSWLD